jgi:hypothetical protein
MIYIYVQAEMLKWKALKLSIYSLKNEGQEGKTGLFQGKEGRGYREKVNECEYGGDILYSYMKIE